MNMPKSIRSRKREKGFTLIELLGVAAIIGILLAIAIPNLIKARISANEVSARKGMQTLWDAEGEYFEQDLDGNGIRDYTAKIGDINTGGTLRCPPQNGSCTEEDALIDITFEGSLTSDTSADCSTPKAGYCIKYASDASTDPKQLQGDFGWQSSMISVNKTGRKDFAVYGDKSIRCSVSTKAAGSAGTFEADRNNSGCD
jgi:type IV pilus assembly protein PilA